MFPVSKVELGDVRLKIGQASPQAETANKIITTAALSICCMLKMYKIQLFKEVPGVTGVVPVS
jgi:hypothetical protein